MYEIKTYKNLFRELFGRINKNVICSNENSCYSKMINILRLLAHQNYDVCLICEIKIPMQEFEPKVQGAYVRGKGGRDCGILQLIKLYKPRDLVG